MPLNPEQLKSVLPQLRSLITQYNKMSELDGTGDNIPQPPVFDFEIDNPALGNFGTAGPISSVASAITGKPSMSPRTSGLMTKGLLETAPFGAGKAFEPEAYKALQPENLGESLVLGGTQAASQLGQIAGASLVPGGVGLNPLLNSARIGGIYGAQENLIPNIKEAQQTIADGGNAVPAYITAGRKTIVDSLKGAGTLAAYHALFSGTSAAVSSFTPVKKMVEDIALKSGWGAADRALNMTLTAANTIVGGLSIAALEGFKKDVPGFQKLADILVGAGLGAMTPSVEAKRSIKFNLTRNPEYMKYKELGYSPEEVDNFHKTVAERTNMIDKSISDVISPKLVSINDLAQKTISPMNLARGYRALAERDTINGDAASAEINNAEAQKQEIQTPAYQDLVRKKSVVDGIVQEIANTTTEDVIGKYQKFGVKLEEPVDTSAMTGKQKMVNDYLNAELDYNTALIKFYGSQAEKMRPIFEQETAANTQARVANQIDSLQKQIDEIKSKKSIQPVVPPTSEPKVKSAIPKSMLEEHALADIASNVATRGVTEAYKSSGIEDQLQLAVSREWLGGQETNPFEATKRDMLLTDQERQVIDLSARTLTGKQESRINDVFRTLAEMLPGAEQNPLFQSTALELMKGTSSAEIKSAEDLQHLFDELGRAGLLFDKKGKFWDAHQMNRFVQYREQTLPSNKFSSSELTKFEKANTILQKFYDQYFDKLNAYRASVGREPLEKVENYITWLDDFRMIDIDHIDKAFDRRNQFVKPSSLRLRYEHLRGKIAPESRMPLPLVLQKYVYDVNLAIEQGRALHAANRYQRAFSNLAKERSDWEDATKASKISGEVVPPTDLQLPSERYEAASKFILELANGISGMRTKTKTAEVLDALGIPKLTNQWAGQVVSTPTTMINQIFSLAPIASETGMKRALNGLSSQLQSTFWKELQGVVENPKLLAHPEQDSIVYQSRLNSRLHEQMISDSNNVMQRTVGRYVGRVISNATHQVDLMMVGAAYRAGYAQGIDAGLTPEQAKLHGDYIAGKTQAVYETTLRPLMLQDSVGKVFAPLVTSSFASFNTFREAVSRDIANVRSGKPLNATSAATFFATAVLLRMITNAIRPDAGNPVVEAVMDNIPVLGTMTRFGQVGAFGNLTRIYNAKKEAQVIQNLITLLPTPPGSLQVYNTALGLQALLKNGVISDKNGRELYRIDPNNAAEVARAVIFGPNRTEAGAKHLSQYFPDITTRISNWFKSKVK